MVRLTGSTCPTWTRREGELEGKGYCSHIVYLEIRIRSHELSKRGLNPETAFSFWWLGNAVWDPNPPSLEA